MKATFNMKINEKGDPIKSGRPISPYLAISLCLERRLVSALSLTSLSLLSLIDRSQEYLLREFLNISV